MNNIESHNSFFTIEANYRLNQDGNHSVIFNLAREKQEKEYQWKGLTKTDLINLSKLINDQLRLDAQLVFPGGTFMMGSPEPEMIAIPGGTFMMGFPEPEMIAIPGGTFLMGSPSGEGEADEHPQHEVTVSKFWIGKYPVTQAQYLAVMDENPSYFSGNPDNPVEQVSWYDAVKFCAKLSKLTGKDYKLPTEAQWEYACRANTTTPFHFGQELDPSLANYNQNNNGTTHVGQFSPNAFGLYDMHGQVWEWCDDTWHDNYVGAPTDGSAWTKDGNQSRSPLRGGSWYDHPEHCRSASRYYLLRRDLRDDHYGFRVVCGLEDN